ncbi:MAG TPA: tetratricopeptide repeat protein [Vicinamibacterales bacterium]|nr:tetratricopeptide repeat protein [Vicinamibacterales bacterium]
MLKLRGYAIVCTLMVCVVACTSKEQQKQTHYKAGNAALEKHQYAEAALAYRNALKIDPLFGDARLKLAQTYEKSGDLGNAIREYVRAADLLPDNIPVQITAAKYLLMAGQMEDARARAKRAVDRAPQNAEAHIVLGSAIAGMKDLDGAMKEIEEAITLSPNSSLGYTNKAGLLLAQGRRDDALANFQKAVQIEPRSVDARLALAGYYWNVGAVKDAETTISGALELEPAKGVSNRVMALLYLSTGRAMEAEPYVKAMVTAAGTSDAQLQLADYYLRTGRVDSARPILEKLTADKTVAATANVRLAQLEYEKGDHAAAYKRLDGVIASVPTSVDARVVKARYLAADGRLKEALPEAEAAVKTDPKSAVANYVLGTIRAALGQTAEAKASFGEVLKLNPRAASAQTALSALDLSSGSTETAVQLARDAVANQPNQLLPRLLLVRGLLARGDLDRASAELAPLTAKLPQDPRVRALNGTLLLLKKDTAGARREYEGALQRDPYNVDALNGLVSLDAQMGQPLRWRDRVNSQLAQRPSDPGLLLLAARLDLQASDLPAGEAKLRHVVEVQPANLQAYSLLGGLYLKEKKLDEARREFEALATRQSTPVGANTMVGMILQMQNNPDEAIKAYQRALKFDPSAPVAANNVAYLYAERGGNLEQALALAKAASDRLPDEPAVTDTVGWVYYKKKLPALAVPLLEKCVTAAPRNPLFQYHLGLAYVGTGDKQKGRRALEESLRLNPTFEGAADARQVLASLPS